MPDHLHLLVEALRSTSDLCLFLKNFKQGTSFHYRRSVGGRLWQDSYHDHVLREDEPSEVRAGYLLGNPVRAGLVQQPSEWPYMFSEKYDLQTLLGSIDVCRATCRRA
jgi:putative transposase